MSRCKSVGHCIRIIRRALKPRPFAEGGTAAGESGAASPAWNAALADRPAGLDSPRQFSRRVSPMTLLACLFLVSAASLRGAAADPSVASGPTEPQALAAASGPAAASKASDPLESRRAEVAQRLALAQQTLRAYQAQRVLPPDDLMLEMELLKWLDLTCSQRQAGVEQARILEQKLNSERSEAGTAEPDGYTTPSTCTFVELEAARDELDDAASHRRSLDLEMEATRGLAQSAHESQASCESQRRLAREALERCNNAKSKPALMRQLELAQLKCQATEEAVRLREEEVKLYQTECAINDLQLQSKQKKLQRLEKSVTFTAEELENQLALLDRAEAEIRRGISAAQNQVRQAQSAAPQTAGIATMLPQASSPLTVGNANGDGQNIQWHQESMSLLQQSLQDIFLKRILWKRRYDLAHRTVSADQLPKWHDEAKDYTARLVNRKELIQIRLQNHTTTLTSLRSRPSAETANAAAAARISEIERLVSFYTNHLQTLQADERLLTRYQKEISSLESNLPTGQWFAVAWERCRELWNYELTSVNDRPVTVAKIVCGVILLITGFVFSRISSAIFRRRVVPRLKLDDGAAAAVQSIVFYVVLLCSTLFSLELVHLPLTAFTFMGGAVAIGIGFGSQNVLSNFISGLILLVERPVRVGDVVHIDGLNGTVDAIGARSTRLRTGSNFEIMVPNSKFLENTVTNWTLSDARIRTMVGVGVAYGSNTREVEQLLRSIVQQRADVFQQPEPIVVFKDFGDNTLLFETHFWIDARSIMGGELIKSEIRHTIDEAFRESRISIAYPQRDVHLDVQSPIQVQVHSAVGQPRHAQHLRAA